MVYRLIRVFHDCGGNAETFCATFSAIGDRMFLRLLFVLILSLPTLADAATYYVRTDGHNTNCNGTVDASDASTGTANCAWLTVQKAADTMVAGDTVIVGNGTYVEADTVITTSGTSGNPITYQAQNTHSAIMSYTGPCWQTDNGRGPGFNITASHIVLRGFRIQANASRAGGCTYSSADAAIRHWGGAGLVVDSVRLDTNIKWHTGFKVQGTGDIVENCTVENEIEGMNAADIIIRNNTVTVGGPNATYILVKGGAANALVYDNHITVSNTGSVGAVLLGGDSCNGCTTYPDLIECLNCVGFNNIAVNTTGTTVALYTMWGCTNCALFNNVGIGGYLGTRTSPSNGIATLNPTFLNNIMSANGLSGDAVATWSTFTGTRTINYNNFFGYSSTPSQTNPITGDPQFVNSAGDWHLQTSSPAIEAGTTVTPSKFGGGSHTVDFDYDGLARVAPWDAGVYETPPQRTFYWASATGSHSATCANIDSSAVDVDPGSYGTINRAANCATAAGDVVVVKAGTYSGNNHRIKMDTDCMNNCFKSGTSDSMRTWIMGDPTGARPVINIPEWFSSYGYNAFHRDWYGIKYLLIDGTGGPTSDGSQVIMPGGGNIIIDDVEIRNATFDAIAAHILTTTAVNHHLTVKNSALHDYGQTPLNNGYSIYYEGEDLVFENNHVYNGNGAGMQVYSAVSGQNSHRAIIRYNYIHDITAALRADGSSQCWGIIADGNDVQIYRNIVDGATCTLFYGIGVSGQRAKIYHNTVMNWPSWPVEFFSATTGNLVSNNIFIGNGNSNNVKNTGVATVTEQTNKKATSVTGCISATTFALTAGSTCIGAGTALTGVLQTQFNGSLPDQGAFESFTFSSGTVNENNMDVTLGMSLNTPVLPASGQTTWAVNNSRTVTAASRLTGSDSVVRITFNGAVCAGESWTAAYTASNVTDSSAIGGANWANLNQPLLTFSAQSVTNNCGSPPPSDPGTPTIHYTFEENTGTNVADQQPVTGGDQPGTLTNGPSWTAGHTGFGVSFADSATEQYVAVPYGSGVNPSTQSLTICLGVLPHSTTPSQKIVFSADNGSSQRFYIGWVTNGASKTWQLGIQSSGFGQTASEFPLVAEWTRLCVVSDSGADPDTATLYVNGVAGGTANASVKTFTSYTLASNFKVGVGTFSTNYGGSTADDLKIYTSALSASDIEDDYQNWAQASPAPTGIYSQVTHKWQRLRRNAGGTADDFTVSGVTNGISISVMVSGAIALVTQIDCTTANCDPTGLKLHVSKNGGAFMAVPDDCNVIGVCFYGNPDIDVVSGTVECCLTGALTENDGPTNTTASAIPVFDLTQDASIVRRSVLRFSSTVSVGDTFDFKEYHQTDFPMDSYTPSGGARVTIANPSIGVGF
jgi:hypothetical protein